MIKLPRWATPSILKWSSAGLITLAILAAITWQRLEVHGLHADLAASRADLADIRAAAQRCAVDLGVQTMQVNAWQSAAEERARKAQLALKEAALYRGQAQAKKTTLYALQLPSEECDALKSLVDTARGHVADGLRRLPIAPE